MIIYKHTQTGYLIIAIFSLTILAMLGLSIQSGFHQMMWIVLTILGLVLAIFARQTVIVTNQWLEFYFNFGVFRKRILLDQVTQAKAVRNPWYYGWGIHLTPRGWLYNVSGRNAVEITMINGRHFRIGSDEPDQLAKVISNNLNTLLPAKVTKS
jgi:hypothetical protein